MGRRSAIAALLFACAAIAVLACWAWSDRLWALHVDAATTSADASDVWAKADSLPHDQYGELVRQGYRIFVDTPHYARRYSGNALSCGNCHLDAGQRANASPMWAAWGMYPMYLAKTNAVNTFEERIQQCFRFSMNGVPPPQGSQELRALTVYAQWLAKGQPVGVALPGRGFATVQGTGVDGDPQHGHALYAQRCAVCHGGNGEGKREESGKYLFPPLWGWHSFNKGAGMYRAPMLAAFLKANMPYGNANLADQEALDLAAWITQQKRWPDPRKPLLSRFFQD